MSIDKESVKERIDCKQILLQHGIDYRGRDISCPLPGHNDKNPSFGLCHDNKGYKCHGSKCEESGDIFKLEMALSGVDFNTALATLARLAGVQDVDTPPQKQSDGPKLHPTPERAAKAQLWSVQQMDGYSDATATLVHDYRKKDGELVARVLRFDTQDSKVYRPIHKEKDGWKSGDPRGKWPIYRLPEMGGEGIVYVFEGEKCPDAAAEMGLVNCTTSPHGHKSADLADWKPIHGRDMVIFADNDDAGMRYARDVVKLAKPKTVKIIQFTHMPKKSDIVDWLEERDAIDPEDIIAELKSVIEKAGFVDPDKEPELKKNANEVQADKGKSEQSAPPDRLDGYYYATNNRQYVAMNERGRYISRVHAQFTRFLKSKGLSTKKTEDETMSETDQFMLDLEEHKDVEYIGPLAGRCTGFYDENGVRFLVTSSPVIIAPEQGEWPTIRRMMESVFQEEELIYVHAWLKVGYESLAAGHLMPGQALAIVGPANCFKSFIQREIFTPILGGRSGRPFQFMTGGSQFNSDLFGTEHLMIEDESASTDIRARRNMGSLIKNFTVNVDQRCHGKGQDALMLRPFWRVSITMNDEPENLLVLPPLDESLKDKIIILEAREYEDPPSTSTIEERRALVAAIQRDLPAYVDFLVNMEIPKHLKSDRFGVRHYHNGHVLEVLDDSTPETKLMEMIQQEIEVYWEGTSGELQARLQDGHSSVRKEAEKLLHWYGACGTYLGRLHKKHPDKIRVKRMAEGRRWEIL